MYFSPFSVALVDNCEIMKSSTSVIHVKMQLWLLSSTLDVPEFSGKRKKKFKRHDTSTP